MLPEIHLSRIAIDGIHTVYLINQLDDLKGLAFDQKALDYAKTMLDLNDGLAHINKLDQQVYVIGQPKGDKSADDKLEWFRKKGHEVSKSLATHKARNLQIIAVDDHIRPILGFAEGVALSGYEFNKYKTDKTSRALHSISLVGSGLNERHIAELGWVLKGVFTARDLVNEPVIYLTAEQLSKELGELASEFGFDLEVWNKKEITARKMGGLLAVNAGSPNHPTYNILSYKHPKPALSKPVVLVGKGVVYDTGGLSLKPTPGSMDSMKCDMAGAAAVIGAFLAVVQAQLPIHLIGLIPATENRPDGNAITPGDVITMMSGKTVEVLNTDAEGRLILADALHHAKDYDPALVIDLATLTGAAARAIGKEGIVGMGTAEKATKTLLTESGSLTCERVVEFPLWAEYEEYMRSEVADLKNIGGADAGAITAGIFLKHFTDYPWMHLDIAGSAFKEGGEWNYRGKGGTGVGVRLLYSFLKELVK